MTPAEKQTFDSLLKFKDAAGLLVVSLRQFRRIVDGGDIPFVMIGERSPRVKRSDLTAYLEMRTVRRSQLSP
jgi:excisionase family DNA binding protein